LNVFVPQTIKTGDKKAVMFFMHGGNFQYYGGNAALFNSTFYAAMDNTENEAKNAQKYSSINYNCPFFLPKSTINEQYCTSLSSKEFTFRN
jgi:hypothetical protein